MLTARTAPLVRLFYGLYAWLVLACFGLPVTVACLLIPGIARRRAIARFGAASVLALIGSPVRVSGRMIGDYHGSIVVANHASYLDGVILTAVLPPQYTFLIKQEMNAVPLAGFVLRRLGSEFVDRANSNRRHRSARRLVHAARSGQPLAVFPEGTFDERPGLRAFHMGAFRAAWRTGLTVIPVVIRGARHKLPGDDLLAVPGPLAVEFCEALVASDYDSDQALMRATRAAILARLDEPDLEASGSEPSTADGHV